MFSAYAMYNQSLTVQVTIARPRFGTRKSEQVIFKKINEKKIRNFLEGPK